MPRARKPLDPETDEPLMEPEDAGALSLESAPKPDRRGKVHKSISVKLAEERLRRLRQQNKKLAFDYKAKAGGYVFLEDIKRKVLAANVSVKNQVLAVIERANLPRESKKALRQDMVHALNDLAYEHSDDSELILS